MPQFPPFKKFCSASETYAVDTWNLALKFLSTEDKNPSEFQYGWLASRLSEEPLKI